MSGKEPIKILIVDDHAVVRAGLRFILQKRDEFKIIGEAENRSEALAAVKKELPNIILLDLDLGSESGLDMISELKSNADSARIIVLTGLRDADIQRRAVRLGAMGLVQKDKAADNVIAAIEKVHAGEAWLDPLLIAGLITEISEAEKTSKPDPEDAKIGQLTKREREVIALVGKGLKAAEIAERLFISEITVRHHLTSIFSKLEVSDRVELMIYSYRNGLSSPPQ